MLEVHIYCNRKHIGHSKFFRIHQNRICLIDSSFYSSKTDLQIGSVMEIRCIVNEVLCDTFEIEIQKINKRQNSICVNGILCFFPIAFQQFVYVLLYKWNNDQFHNWENLSKPKKRLWVKACLLYSGLPNNNIKDKIITVDFSNMQNIEDFYIILGEAIIGPKGYFGQDLHGLQDCLHEMQRTGANNFSLEITGFQHFCEIVDHRSKSFSKWFIELMEKNGVLIITDSRNL